MAFWKPVGDPIRLYYTTVLIVNHYNYRSKWFDHRYFCKVEEEEGEKRKTSILN